MSPRPARARRTLAALVLVATTVSGCASVERSVVGIHDAPTEEAEGAPMSRAEASSTARTALDAAAAAPRGRTAAVDSSAAARARRTRGMGSSEDRIAAGLRSG